MNLLQLTQQMCLELGIQSPGQVTTSSDPQTLQIYAIANRVGRELAEDFEWQRLVKEGLITTVVTTTTGTLTAGSTQIQGMPSTAGLSTNYGVSGIGILPFAQVVSVDSSTQVTMNMAATESGTVSLTFAQVLYPLPTDWSREIPQTEWDRTNRWPLNGPKSSQEWQNFKSGIVYAGPRLRFRIRNGSIELNPVPTASGILSYEYVSSNWALSATGTGKESFTADTDTCIYRDTLMVAAMKLRWLQTKGLDYSYALNDYMDLLSKAKAQDKSAPKLMLSSDYPSVLLSSANVMDGNWPA